MASSPGPWTYEKSGVSGVAIIDAAGQLVIEEYAGAVCIGEDDARLIAAAPELADVLRRLLAELGPLHRFPESKIRGLMANGFALLSRIDPPTTGGGTP